MTRVYRSNDSTSRAFGVGSSMTYSMALYQPDSHNYSWADLVFADGSRVRYERISPGSGYTDMVLEARTTPSRFYKSRILWNGRAWELTLTDGTVYTFPNGGLLESIRDRFGNQTTILRSSQFGDITQVLSSSGRWLKFSYGGSGRVSQVQDQSGRSVGYAYDGAGRLWKVTDARGGVTEYTYDGGGRLASVKDPRNIVWLQNHYDGNGRIDSQTLPDGGVYQFAYTTDGNGKVTQTDVTNPRGYLRRVTFNSDGYPLSDTLAVGTPRQQATSYQYQAGTNLLLSETDQRNRRTEYEYNSVGRLTKITRLAGTGGAVSTSFGYEPSYNQLASVSDPLGHGPSFQYDARGALIKVTDARGKETTLVPNIAGRPVTITDPLGKQTAHSYALGDLTSTTDPRGSTMRLFDDNAGRLTRVTDAMGGLTRYAYDAADALTERDRRRRQRDGVRAGRKRQPHKADRRQAARHRVHLRLDGPSRIEERPAARDRDVRARQERQSHQAHRPQGAGHDPELRRARPPQLHRLRHHRDAGEPELPEHDRVHASTTATG